MIKNFFQNFLKIYIKIKYKYYILVLTYKDLKIIMIYVNSKIVIELEIIDVLKLAIVILKKSTMNFVLTIDQKTVSIKNFLIKQFLINKK